MTAEHTPTPWELEWEEEEQEGTLYAPSGLRVAKVTKIFRRAPGRTPTKWEADEATVRANAAFIVRAVNAHDALVAALDDVCRVADDMVAGQRGHDPECRMCKSVRKARAAIAQATGSEGARS